MKKNVILKMNNFQLRLAKSLDLILTKQQLPYSGLHHQRRELCFVTYQVKFRPSLFSVFKDI